MKKTLKKLSAVIASLAVLTTSSISASAILIEKEFKSEAYQEYIEDLVLMPHQDKVLKVFENYDNIYEYINAYYSKKTYEQLPNVVDLDTYITMNVYLEYGDETYRGFRWGVIYWDKMSLSVENVVEDLSQETINGFLSENNYKAEITSFKSRYDEKAGEDAYNVEIEINYAEDVTEEDVLNITSALSDKFGLSIYALFLAENSGVFENEFSSPTLAGDLNLDDEQGITDIVTLTKYTASPELYPITDATALANADVNQDGKIDSLDTNILIEMTLGSFESAV